MPYVAHMKFDQPTDSAQMTPLERGSYLLDHYKESDLTPRQDQSLKTYRLNAIWFAGGLHNSLNKAIDKKKVNQQATLKASLESVTIEDIANVILSGDDVKTAFPEDIQNLKGVWKHHTPYIKSLQKHIPTFSML